MNRVRQVGHMMWKDVREARWLAASYVALCVLSTLVALSGQVTEGSKSAVGMPVVFCITGALLTAVLLQHDSPTNPRAFWLVRPYSALSVIVAKVSSVFGLAILAPLLGHAFILARHEIGWTAEWSMLVDAVRIAVDGALLCALMGALTRDLRGFVLAMVGLLISYMLWAIAFGSSHSPFAPVRTGLIVLQPAWTASMCVMLLVLYLVKAEAPRGWLAALIVAFGANLAAITVDAMFRDDGGLASASKLMQITGVRMTTEADGSPAVSIDVAVTPLDSATNLVLRDATVTLFTAGDTTHSTATVSIDPERPRAEYAGGGTFTLYVAPRRGRAVADSLSPPDRVSPIAMRVPTDFADAARKSPRGSSIFLDGTIAAETSSIAELPIAEGADVNDVDGSTTIMTVERAAGGVLTMRRRFRIASASSPVSQQEPVALQYRLVNRVRGEWVMLEAGGAPTTPLPLLLPGPSLDERTFPLTVPHRDSVGLARVADVAWMRDARLMIVRPNRVSVKHVVLHYVMP